MKKLTIIRGPSGSGKSTLARKLLPEGPIFEADDYFTKDGLYLFNPYLIKTAHLYCQMKVENSMKSNCPHIIVSNTCIRRWEMQKYLDLAVLYQYETEILVTDKPWDADLFFQRNVHGVPLETIKKHIASFQE
jgi:predicted kinase